MTQWQRTLGYSFGRDGLIGFLSAATLESSRNVGMGGIDLELHLF